MRVWRYLVLASTVAMLNCASMPVPPASPPFLYDSIDFDIAYVESARPQQRALNLFRLVLDEQRICDDRSVSFSVRPAARMSTNLIWNVPMLMAFQSLNNGRPSHYSDTDDIRVFVAFVHGAFLPPPHPDRVVCGYAYGNTAFAALVDHYNRDAEEVALLLHEFGHVLDIPEDVHCPDSTCVMYEFVRRDGARFCAKCLDRIEQLRQGR